MSNLKMEKRFSENDHREIQRVMEKLGKIFSSDPEGKDSGRAVILTVLVYYAQLPERQNRGNQLDVMDEIRPFICGLGWNYPGKPGAAGWIDDLFEKVKRGE